MRNGLITTALIGALTLYGSTAIRADSLTLSQKNAFALETTMTMDMSMLVQNFGAQPDVLAYMGAFSDLGWTSRLNGTYAGLPLNVSYTATFDQASAAGHFTSTGTLGNGAYTGSGSWGFTDIDALSTGMAWGGGVTLGLNPPPGPPPVKGPFPDIHAQLLLQALSSQNTVTVLSSGEYYRTLGGDPIEGVYRINDQEKFILPEEWFASVRFDDGTSLAGTSNFHTGTSTGTVSAVPEPSSVALLSTGLVLLSFRGLLQVARRVTSRNFHR
jgi:hypothetical protein